MRAGDDCGQKQLRKSVRIGTETPATFSTTLWELGRDLRLMVTNCQAGDCQLLVAGGLSFSIWNIEKFAVTSLRSKVRLPRKVLG